MMTTEHRVTTRIALCLIVGLNCSTAFAQVQTLPGRPATNRISMPIRIETRLFQSKPNCPTAKLDLWLAGGVVDSMLFMPEFPGNPGQKAVQTTHTDTGLLPDAKDVYVAEIGPPECHFRVLVEAVEDHTPKRDDEKEINFRPDASIGR